VTDFGDATWLRACDGYPAHHSAAGKRSPRTSAAPSGAMTDGDLEHQSVLLPPILLLCCQVTPAIQDTRLIHDLTILESRSSRINAAANPVSAKKQLRCAVSTCRAWSMMLARIQASGCPPPAVSSSEEEALAVFFRAKLEATSGECRPA